MYLSKMQVTLANVRSQLNMEKVSDFAKDNRIKTLEDLVIKLGYDPANVNAAEELIKKKKYRYCNIKEAAKITSNRRSFSKGY